MGAFSHQHTMLETYVRLSVKSLRSAFNSLRRAGTLLLLAYSIHWSQRQLDGVEKVHFRAARGVWHPARPLALGHSSKLRRHKSSGSRCRSAGLQPKPEHARTAPGLESTRLVLKG